MNVPAGDLLLLGGRVHLLDPARTMVEAVLIEDGVVVAAGKSGDLAARAGDATPRIDLAGRNALPGLIDAHAHLELSTLAARRWVDVVGVPVAETVRRIAAAVRDTPADGWAVAQGTFGQPLPGRVELDAIAHGRPVVIRESMHRQVANSSALRAAGIDRRFVEPVGTRVGRGVDGEPTGAIEEGFDLFPVPGPDAAWFERALPAQAAGSFVRHGVTTVHELPASAAALEAWRQLAAADRMPCRIVLNPILAPGHQPTVTSVEALVELRSQIHGLHPWLSVGALKLFLDGAGEAAWTRDQLAGGPSGWGLTPYPYADLRRVLAECREHGVQVWMHAVGGLAQELALDAVEQTNRSHPAPDHRTRVEHVGNAVCDPALLPRLAPAGVVPVPTASFMHRYRPSPPAGRNVPFPFRTMLEFGLRPPGNSDSAGTQPFATSPWHGVAAAVLRRTGEGEPVPPESEAIPLPDAIRLPTAFAAHATFAEDRSGSLAPGMAGDVAVFSCDPTTADPAGLAGLEADMTIVAGRIVWTATSS